MQKIEYKPPSMALIENEFSMLDRTNCGYITVNNFYDMMRRIKCNYSKKVIEDMVAAIDSDKNNRITLDEFMNLFY
jgi:Ca2+-binding EF-hand superfamily protein